MLKHLRIAIILLTVAPFYGCDNGEEVIPIVVDEKLLANPSRELDGKYDVISLISEIPVDLDRNGNFSTDILQETKLQSDSLKYFLQLSTIRLNGDNELFYQKVYMWVPQTGIFVDDKGTYIATGYGVSGIFGYYRYYSDNGVIKIVGETVCPAGMILNAKLVNGNLLLNFKQFYYTSKGWEEINIVGTYTKRK